MDQSAFRSLLDAPRSAGESSKRVLGAPAPKRGWTGKSKSSKEYEKNADSKDDGPMMAPRSHQRNVAQGKYKDRAQMRREGVDDEYKPVEKLLEELEQRAKDAGDDAEDVDKARQYLGGDAEHSILVKGLDYSLLAARKAELARQKEDVADDVLDALLGGEKAKPKEVLKPKQEEPAAKGFRSISQKDEEKPKKKKKKKKVKVEEALATAPAKAAPEQAKVSAANEQHVLEAAIPEPVPEVESEPDVDDIFGDAGEYDLATGHMDGDSLDDSDVEAGRLADGDSPSRPRSRSIESGSRHRGRSPSEESKDRSRRDHSRDRRRDRSDSDQRYESRRDRSQDRYRNDRDSGRDYRREKSDSRDRYARDRSNSRDRYMRNRSDSRDRYRRDRIDSRDRYRRDRSDHPSRYRDDSPDRYEPRSRVRDRHDYRSGRSPSPKRLRLSRSPQRSDSRSPKRRRYSPSRSSARDPPARKSRSPSPLFNPYAVQSRSPSPSSDEGQPFTGKLQPLASSAIADVKGFLSADADAAKAEEKKAKKAAWRARQGLGPQEGAEDAGKRDMNDKQKFNRDYVVLMNKMKKDEETK